MTDPAPSRPAAAGNDVFQERMAALKRRFVERAREDAAALAALQDEIADQLERGGNDRDLHRRLVRLVHGLAGAAGIFGYEAISETAFQCELKLRHDDAVTAGIGPDLARLTARLTEVIAEASQRGI